ncbi:MarR family transcriptional regulator [Ruminococcus sp. Marseille-P6503]|uniref:MarR family transcriptional regulator n=1 Tax=Ruminococcus sp. Marseille-P6503 TaxID=2364796 RepID=UPI000F5214A1|nr:MarR family transcriptional regulator [Ruminococcus sp. Marseille-P6503]
MNNKTRTACIGAMYELYPLCRKLVFDTFDKRKYGITRTQQIILLALAIEEKLTMSQLASKINTSNEQATRAVAQLVEKGFIERMQDNSNRRIINIRLTEKADDFIEKTKAEIMGDLLDQFNGISDEDMEKFHDAVVQIIGILKKAEA